MHCVSVARVVPGLPSTRVHCCIGIERFKVLRICEERPVLICEVEVLEEDDDSHPEVQLWPCQKD